MEREPADRVATLVAGGQLTEAAILCARHGAHGRAAVLFEQACEFALASEQAELAGDPRNAVRLAVLSGDAARSDRVIAALVSRDPALALLVAAELADRGHHRHAGELYRGGGRAQDAAAAYQRAGLAHEAAACWEAAGKPAEAARVLESAIVMSPGHDEDRMRAQLGKLYARHGKHEASVRVLQRLARGSAWRREALGTLAGSLEALGLVQARRDLDAELGAHGVVVGAGGDPQPAAASGGTLWGRYRVVSEVAQTPHARLLEAVDELSGDRVAVKLMAARAHGTGRDALDRFVREARALGQLRHPNVVPLRDWVPDGPAMVLAWMAGGSLRELLDREPMAPARAAEIAGAVLAALAEAHRFGIVHRDIKPSNVLFDDGGTPRLADFGAAHLASSEATVTVGEIGTIAYMAPEQRKGGAASAQSDVYSVGVLLHEMLTGELPPAQVAIDLGVAHPDLDGRHDALLMRLLAEAPADRFDGARAAHDAMTALSWSGRVVPRRDRARARASSKPPPAPGGRLVAAGRGDARFYEDQWLARHVLVLPLDDAELARAAAFARAGHPLLDVPVRVDKDAGSIWIEAPEDGSETCDALPTSDVERLEAALGSLHAVGGSHGWVDAAHVYRHAGVVRLAYPLEATPDASAERDLAMLAALRARHGE